MLAGKIKEYNAIPRGITGESNLIKLVNEAVDIANAERQNFQLEIILVPSNDDSAVQLSGDQIRKANLSTFVLKFFRNNDTDQHHNMIIAVSPLIEGQCYVYFYQAVNSALDQYFGVLTPEMYKIDLVV